MQSPKYTSKFMCVFDDGSATAPNTRWSQLVSSKRSDAVKSIIIRGYNSVNGKEQREIILERSCKVLNGAVDFNWREQFFQLWIGIETNLGNIPKMTNIIGKVYNNLGDCVVIVHDQYTNNFLVTNNNVHHLINGGPINFELLGIDLDRF